MSDGDRAAAVPMHLRAIADMAREIGAGRISSREATDVCLEQIAAANGRLNAFITVLGDSARRDANRADEEMASGRCRGALHGIPVSFKDLIDVAGVPTTAASRLLDGHVAPTDAPVAALLRSAGCIFVGKCNLHEFAFGTTSEDSAYGPVRNPFDPTRSPGGSSGGSAAAVATGMSYASIGTDTGGSIRIPASACGCVGLKPTYGEISCDGIVPLSASLDHVGPITRSVADAWLIYDALTGRPADRLPQRDLPGTTALRLGVLGGYFTDLLEDEVRRVYDAALGVISNAGARQPGVGVRHAGDIATVYLHLQLPEASAYHAEALERQPGAFTPAVRLRLEMGRYVLAEDYIRAREGAAVLRREVDAALDGCEALVLPTLPISPQAIGEETVRIGGGLHPVRALMLRLTQLFDVTGHPAISIPCGFTRSNLPVGLQLVGHRGRTTDLLRVAATVEAALARRD